MNCYCIYSNGAAPEDGSVFYSTVVLAEDENEAVFKYILEKSINDTDCVALQDEFICKGDLDPNDPDYDEDAFESRLDIIDMDWIS